MTGTNGHPVPESLTVPNDVVIQDAPAPIVMRGNLVVCDFGDKCPGHASPNDRPCGYIEKPKRRRKPVPIAPAGTVPSDAVKWVAKLMRDTETKEYGAIFEVEAQTWYVARDAAMAEWGCGPGDLEVNRA